ncbi:hypothetical protein ABZ307_24900, partial [Streptomyces griseorubiginosus]|uniref:hypothetical protein n=1 Tax=Streptomyces griseorubiginosus TaxID=67304 RepID=UPI0033AE5B20
MGRGRGGGYPSSVRRLGPSTSTRFRTPAAAGVLTGGELSDRALFNDFAKLTVKAARERFGD